MRHLRPLRAVDVLLAFISFAYFPSLIFLEFETNGFEFLMVIFSWEAF